MNKETFIQDIKSNIEKFGYHVTYVMADLTPSFSYTIGLTEKFNFELVLAGGIYYKRVEIEEIVTKVTSNIIERQGSNFDPINLGDLGTFSLSPVDKSWSKLLMLGVYDLYKMEYANVYQIIPDKDHYTLDIPNMSGKFSVESAPVWQWLVKEWEYNVPKDSDVGTDIFFLMGEPLTEISRWEENYWEMYHLDGEDVSKEQIRIVSLGTMLAIDPTILPALDLPIGKGLLRDNLGDEWRRWHW